MLFKFYGVDWLVFIFVLLQVYLLGNYRKSGFIAGIIATIFSLVFSCMTGSIANFTLGLCLLCLHFRGYLQWNQKELRDKKYRNKQME